jgi:hypothetical protein
MRGGLTGWVSGHPRPSTSTSISTLINAVNLDYPESPPVRLASASSGTAGVS